MKGIERAERAPRTIEQVLETGKQAAFDLIREQCLEGHNIEHTEGVMRRARRILETVRERSPDLVTDRLIELSQLYAAFHDSVMDSRTETSTEGGRRTIIRKHYRQDNEEGSARELRKFMDREDVRAFFTDEERELADAVMLHTVPEFENGTAVQKALNGESPLLARAIALADLGEAGMDGFESYKKQGDGFFREINVDITLAFKERRVLSEDDRAFFRARMLEWSDGQVVFAEGRKERFEEEVEGLPEDAKEALRKLFSMFDDTIERTRQLAQQRSGMPFEELAKDMGFRAA